MYLSCLSEPFPHISNAIEIKNICSKIKHLSRYRTFIIKTGSSKSLTYSGFVRQTTH